MNAVFEVLTFVLMVPFGFILIAIFRRIRFRKYLSRENSREIWDLEFNLFDPKMESVLTSFSFESFLSLSRPFILRPDDKMIDIYNASFAIDKRAEREQLFKSFIETISKRFNIKNVSEQLNMNMTLKELILKVLPHEDVELTGKIIKRRYSTLLVKDSEISFLYLSYCYPGRILAEEKIKNDCSHSFYFPGMGYQSKVFKKSISNSNNDLKIEFTQEIYDLFALQKLISKPDSFNSSFLMLSLMSFDKDFPIALFPILISNCFILQQPIVEISIQPDDSIKIYFNEKCWLTLGNVNVNGLFHSLFGNLLLGDIKLDLEIEKNKSIRIKMPNRVLQRNWGAFSK